MSSFKRPVLGQMPYLIPPPDGPSAVTVYAEPDHGWWEDTIDALRREYPDEVLDARFIHVKLVMERLKGRIPKRWLARVCAGIFAECVTPETVRRELDRYRRSVDSGLPTGHPDRARRRKGFVQLFKGFTDDETVRGFYDHL